MKPAHKLRLAFTFFVTTASLAAEAEPRSNPTALQPTQDIVRYATARGIPLEKFELAAKNDAMQPGDLVSVLFAITDRAGSREWLSEFRSAKLTDQEAKAKPGTGLGILSVFQSTLHTDTGHAFSFAQSPVALEVRTYGPFTDDQASATEPAVISARVLATRDYLVHGLAPMGEIELRLRAAGKVNPGLSFLFRSKYSDAQMTAAKKRAAEAGFTENDERVYAESIFALVQFAQLAFRTDGVDEIVKEIADSPTLFSGAFTNLDWNNLRVEDGARWGLPGVRVFRLPYRFLSKTKAKGDFYITASCPPLQNTAGVIGLTVDETSKAPGRRLTMRVLASRRATPPP